MTQLTATGFDPNQLIDIAQQRCELSQFDDFPLMEPLTAICRALNEEANLTEQGVQVWQERLINVLCTRLRAQWWWTEHPEILEERIEAYLAKNAPPSPEIERGTKRDPIALSPAGKFQRIMDAASE